MTALLNRTMFFRVAWQDMMMLALVLLTLSCLPTCYAAQAKFVDCLDHSTVDSTYYVPTEVLAYHEKQPNSTEWILRYEITGNMSGQLVDLNIDTNKYIQNMVLQYKIRDEYSRFCDSDLNGCPFGPGPSTLTYNLSVSNAYQGVSFQTKFIIIDSQNNATVVGCVAAEVAPIIASYAWYVVVFGTLGIFIALCLSFSVSSYFNPWTGTSSIYQWSSNSGHDPDAIRLITPGISDYLKYLQFAMFLGALSLDYPMFLPPVLATFSWSSLMFSSNFASGTSGVLQDGIYALNGTYGLTNLGQAIQMPQSEDIWPGFMVWYLVVSGIILLLCLMGFIFHYVWNRVRHNSADRTSTRFPFIGGMGIRLFFIDFGLPVVALSFFQLVINSAEHPPVYCSVLAALLLVAWVASALWISYVLFRTSPQQLLFDDLPSSLCFGPLYNTYSESSPLFFTVDLVATFLRGMAIGALQTSGLAQITLLAVVELAYMISLLYVKPYDRITSMNLLQTILSLIRFVIIFLSIPFVGSLNVSYDVRGWMGYVILLLHALVILLFLVHVIQVLFEVIVRARGAGMAEKSDAVFGLKQLSRRRHTREVSDKVGSIESPNRSPSSPVGLLTKRMSYATSESSYPVRPGSMANRDSIFDEVSVEDSPGAGASARPSSMAGTTGYYRKPRRRQSSHDWAYAMVNDSNSLIEEQVPAKSEDALRAATVSPPPKGVNYATRESDVYFTKRASQREESRFDWPDTGYESVIAGGNLEMSGESKDHEPSVSTNKRDSVSTRLDPSLDHTSVNSSGGSSVWSWMTKLKNNLVGHKPVAQDTESGFQVLRRGPIQYHSTRAGTEAEISRTETSTVEKNGENDQFVEIEWNKREYDSQESDLMLPKQSHVRPLTSEMAPPPLKYRPKDIDAPFTFSSFPANNNDSNNNNKKRQVPDLRLDTSPQGLDLIR